MLAFMRRHVRRMSSAAAGDHRGAIVAVALGAVALFAAHATGLNPLAVVAETGGSVRAGIEEDHTARYSDAPFAPAERAGISILTAIGAVVGNPDGSFMPDRTLTRAEFVKIALALHIPPISPGEPRRCFPDTGRAHWFSPFVCTAKEQGIVRGYSDGLFHPERSVTYAEVIKILVKIGGYPISSEEGTPWYRNYVEAAQERGTLLPESLSYDTALTRGQMARLAAAFVAQEAGFLREYRQTETGEESTEVGGEEEEEDRADRIESDRIASTAASSVSSVAPESPALFPARTRFLMVGERTSPIGDGLVTSDEDAVLRIVRLRLEEESISLKRLWMIAENGNEVVELILGTPDVATNARRTWEREIPLPSPLRFAANRPTRVGFVGEIAPKTDRGIPGTLLQIDEFSLIVQGEFSGNSRQLIPQDTHFPVQQIVQGEIISLQSALPATGMLVEGEGVPIAAFAIAARSLAGEQAQVMELTFDVEKSGVVPSRWMLGAEGVAEQIECATEGGLGGIVTCPAIPATIGNVGSLPRVLRLSADVRITLPQSSLRATLREPGKIGGASAIRWTDGVGRYSWVDRPGPPLAEGTLWTR